LQVGRNPSVISREVATPQPPWRLPAVTAGTAACAARERPKVYAVERSPRGRSARTSSVAPPVVRHSQQALDFMTGVRQGFQKVHETMLMRTNLEKIIIEVRVPPAVTPLGVYRRPWASWGGGSVPFGDLEAGRRLSASGTF